MKRETQRTRSRRDMKGAQRNEKATKYTKRSNNSSFVHDQSGGKQRLIVDCKRALDSRATCMDETSMVREIDVVPAAAQHTRRFFF